jgi:hypothetical protein
MTGISEFALMALHKEKPLPSGRETSSSAKSK